MSIFYHSNISRKFESLKIPHKIFTMVMKNQKKTIHHLRVRCEFKLHT